jgi:hypothetical protein
MKTLNDVEINLFNGKAARMPSTRKIYVLCTVIPFLLFWGGILSPLWTDNFIVYVFALAPYYLYIILLSNDWIESKKLFRTVEGLFASKIWRNSIYACSICSFLSLFLVMPLWETFLVGPCLMLCINAPMAFVGLFYSFIKDRYRYAPPCPDFIA